MTASVPGPDHSAAEESRPINGRCSLASFDEDFIETAIEGLDRCQAIASQLLRKDRVRSRVSWLVRDVVCEQVPRNREVPSPWRIVLLRRTECGRSPMSTSSRELISLQGADTAFTQYE